MARIKNEFPEDVRVVYRHFPLISIHDKAALSTQASEAAGLQGKFWEMHDLLYDRQSEWAGLTEDEFKNWISSRAEELGLDTDQFADDMLSSELADLAQGAWDSGVEIGMPGTPFLLLNNQVWPNNIPMTAGNMSAIVKLELLEERQYTECPPMTIDPSKQYLVTLHTEVGIITMELYPDQAPIAVNNFIFLSQEGWYDGVTFHRVLEGQIAQAGDPTGTGFGGPGYAFVNEVSSGVTFDKPGRLAMANAGPDSNGSQFFITFNPAPQYDGDYTIFGQVIDGMDILESLALRDPSQSFDLPPGDAILGVTIEER
jgi:cyclophilin family peptidyl-prolyl cis-trans isomerase